MISLPLQNNSGTGYLRLTSILLLFLAVCPCPAISAEQSVSLIFSPLSSEWQADDKSAIIPPDNMVAVLGRFNDAEFSVDSVNRITVISPDNKPVPLVIDESSIFRNLGRIVSLSFYFLVAEQAAQDTDSLYTLCWGADVQADNAVVPGIAVNAEMPGKYLEFQWRQEGEPSDSDISSATIEVIADSYANYYSLWYLLPMLLIFVLLTVRKLRGKESLGEQ
jgi:hypothetical protein